MKIAIKANPSRGKEVIQILESLGGINSLGLDGCGVTAVYYIGDNNKIRYNDAPKDYKVYTLEEFETQFPFKVGDLCIYYSDILDKDIVVKILGMTIENDCIMYEVGHKDITKGHSHIYRKREALKPYKEMNTRNVTLTLDKAREWYKKGGDLKQVALQAFTEEELTKVDLPKTWEEFYEQYDFKPILNDCLSAVNNNFSMRYVTKFEAFVKLQYLRDCWRQGNIPQQLKYKIRKVRNIYTVVYGAEDSFLSFCDQQTAEKFLECFRDLIEKAGDLI